MDLWRPLHDLKLVAITLLVLAVLFVLWARAYMNPKDKP